MGKFVVATQDPTLQSDFHSYGNVSLMVLTKIPIIRFVNTNVLDFMPLSDKAEKEIEKKEQKKYLPNEEEMKEVRAIQLEERKEQFREKLEQLKKESGMSGDKLKKRAKGPNPLSVLKKKKPIASPGPFISPTEEAT